MRISDGSSDVCSSDLERAARTACDDPAGRREEALLSAVPRAAKQVYSMRRIAEAVFDPGSVFEMGGRWGRAVITAFARLDGWPVAVLASSAERRVGTEGVSLGRSGEVPAHYKKK